MPSKAFLSYFLQTEKKATSNSGFFRKRETNADHVKWLNLREMGRFQKSKQIQNLDNEFFHVA